MLSLDTKNTEKTRKHKAVMQVSAIWSEAAGESVRKQKQWVAECLMTRAIQEENRMKLTMLGTGNALVTECYNTCFVLSDEYGHFLVDGGGGNTVLSQLKKAGVDGCS